MEDKSVVEQTQEVRALLAEIRDNSDVPTVAHAAHQADVYCHGILWELGAEEAMTPELTENP